MVLHVLAQSGESEKEKIFFIDFVVIQEKMHSTKIYKYMKSLVTCVNFKVEFGT